MAWMRELRLSAPALVIRWAKEDSRPASWRLRVFAASMTGCRREWVAQKYQRRPRRWAQPRRGVVPPRPRAFLVAPGPAGLGGAGPQPAEPLPLRAGPVSGACNA